MKAIVLALSLFTVAYAGSYENKGGADGSSKVNINSGFGIDADHEFSGMGDGHGSNMLFGALNSAADFGQKVIHQGEHALKSIAHKYVGGAGSGKHDEINGHIGVDNHGSDGAHDSYGDHCDNDGNSKGGLSTSSSVDKSNADGGSNEHAELSKEGGYDEKSNTGSTASGSAHQSDNAKGVAVAVGSAKNSKVGVESNS